MTRGDRRRRGALRVREFAARWAGLEPGGGRYVLLSPACLIYDDQARLRRGRHRRLRGHRR